MFILLITENIFYILNILALLINNQNALNFKATAKTKLEKNYICAAS